MVAGLAYRLERLTLGRQASKISKTTPREQVSVGMVYVMLWDPGGMGEFHA